MHLVHTDGTIEKIPCVGQIELKQGMWICGRESSGGGYGNPLNRDPKRVLSDVVEKYVSIRCAREDYGVVFVGNVAEDTLRVDNDATTELRLSRMQ